MLDPGAMSLIPTSREMQSFFFQSMVQVEAVQKTVGGSGLRLSFITRGESEHIFHSREGNRRLRLRWECYQGGGFVSIYLAKRGDLERQRLWQCAYQHTYTGSAQSEMNQFLWRSLVRTCRIEKFEGIFGANNGGGDYSQVNFFEGTFDLFSGRVHLSINGGGGEENNKWVPRGTMTYSGGILMSR